MHYEDGDIGQERTQKDGKWISDDAICEKNIPEDRRKEKEIGKYFGFHTGQLK